MKKILKRVLLPVLLLGGVVVGGLGVRSLLAGRQDTGAFRTVPLERGHMTATITATGTVEPEEVIDVGAQVVGFIKFFGPDPDDAKRTIDYRSRVHKGTLLAQLDDSLFAARRRPVAGPL